LALLKATFASSLVSASQITIRMLNAKEMLCLF